MTDLSQGRPRADPNAPVNSQAWWEWYFEGKWDEYDGAGQSRHFMSLVLEHLPTPEIRRLRQGSVSILDWGCAFGEGTAVLKQAFPGANVTGVDFATKAIATAQQRHPGCRFVHSSDLSPDDTFDVVVSSNCLEHFPKPLDIATAHVQLCRSLYVILVPYNEHPMEPSHRAQLREESFPERLEGFHRLHTQVIKADPRWWAGEQLLVVYGSSRYARERHLHAEPSASHEQGIQHPQDNEGLEELLQEIAAHAKALVAPGGAVLQLGDDPRWHSPTMADKLFERNGLRFTLDLGDGTTTDRKAKHDLVFTLGGIWKAQLEEQVKQLRRLNGRSSGYVLLVIPNPDSYWYWISRIQAASGGAWVHGDERPTAPLPTTLAEAGLHELGVMPLGSEWTENLLAGLAGLGAELRGELLRVHRSGLIAPAHRCGFVGVLASVSQSASAPPAWQRATAGGAEPGTDLLSALADSLALHIARERDVTAGAATIQRLEFDLAREQERSEQLRADLRSAECEADDIRFESQRKLREITVRFQDSHRHIVPAPEGLAQEIEALRRSWSWRIGNAVVRATRSIPGMSRVVRWGRKLRKA